MTYREFEEAVVGKLGYNSVGAFADQTKLLARATATKWKKDSAVPPQMAAYIQLRLDCESRDNTQSVVECESGELAYISGAPCLFDGIRDLRLHAVENDNFAPEFRVGDVVIGEAWNEAQGFSDGYWVFETEEGRKFGILQCLFDGMFRLYGNTACTESYSILFGKEHLRKEMRPVAKIKYHITRKG